MESLTERSAETVEPDRKLYVETYGCQMNYADTEIVNGIMGKEWL